MSILSKIKDFFFEAKKNADAKVEAFKNPQPEVSLVPQPKGDLIGQCGLCQLAIGSEDRIREFQGEKCHKRCVKAAQKKFLRGESFK